MNPIKWLWWRRGHWVPWLRPTNPRWVTWKIMREFNAAMRSAPPTFFSTPQEIIDDAARREFFTARFLGIEIKENGDELADSG